ncbi:MAG: hypothetical protein EBT22_08670, partial [Chloroflexi bacterium]|nr:hypothetical protein [Chloroflexota bacterium]
MSIATLPDDAPSSSAVDLVGNGPPSDGHSGVAREAEVPVVMTGGELRRDVIRLAWPVVVEQLLSTAVSIADVAITGRLGTIALAGSGVALQVFFVVLSGLMSVGIGTTVLVAQATGARTPVRAAGALRQGVVFGGALSIILSIAGIALAGPAVALGGATGEVADTATSFLIVSMLGLAPLTIQIAVGGAMRGAGDTRTPMIAGAIVNVINIVGAWALAFGAWGAPDLGIVGAAWGGNIARLVGAILMVVALFRPSTPDGIRLGKSAPPSRTFRLETEPGHRSTVPDAQPARGDRAIVVLTDVPRVRSHPSFAWDDRAWRATDRLRDRFPCLVAGDRVDDCDDLACRPGRRRQGLGSCHRGDAVCPTARSWLDGHCWRAVRPVRIGDCRGVHDRSRHHRGGGPRVLRIHSGHADHRSRIRPG